MRVASYSRGSLLFDLLTFASHIFFFRKKKTLPTKTKTVFLLPHPKNPPFVPDAAFTNSRILRSGSSTSILICAKSSTGAKRGSSPSSRDSNSRTIASSNESSCKSWMTKWQRTRRSTPRRRRGWQRRRGYKARDPLIPKDASCRDENTDIG